MDTLIKELLTTGGPLGVLVVVVFLFLRFLHHEAQLSRAMVRDMHEEHMAARRESLAVIDRNSESAKEVAQVMSGCHFIQKAKE